MLKTPLNKQPLTNCSQVSTYFDEQYHAYWCLMQATPRPCFSIKLLDELSEFHKSLKKEIARNSNNNPFRYVILASSHQGVFSFGGDLELFVRLIRSKDKEGLASYAKSCIDLIYANMSLRNSNVTSISLIQGDALGGGFETTLSSDVLIAERSSKMGFPEILFNLFPGMGAYSLLSRKIGAVQAERMILSGRIYSAEELYEMGVVDVLAEDLQGEMAVYDYIRKEARSSNGYHAFRKAKAHCNPIPYKELHNIVGIWTDAALLLNQQDLRMMERLIARQSTMAQSAAQF